MYNIKSALNLCNLKQQNCNSLFYGTTLYDYDRDRQRLAVLSVYALVKLTMRVTELAITLYQFLSTSFVSVVIRSGLSAAL